MSCLLLALSLVAADPLLPGVHERELTVDKRARSYLVYLPKDYAHDKATPVVLVMHGAAMNARLMMQYTRLNDTADKHTFIVAYLQGTGLGEFLLTFNSGGLHGPFEKRMPNDVAYTAAVLDDLAQVASIDAQRVYATGLSNGGMMSYRLASELSDRIAAIAPVAGTQAFEKAAPKRPVPVLHFHGTEDQLVRYKGPPRGRRRDIHYKSVDDTLAVWRQLNACDARPTVEEDLPDMARDNMTSTRTVWSPPAGRAGAEVVLIRTRGGGHSWPGSRHPLAKIGAATEDISANELMWEFFARHSLP